MRDAFRVRLRVEYVPVVREFPLQVEVVLEYAVVYDHYVAGAVGVRVRVEVGRPSVGCPASMPNAAAAVGQSVA